MLINGYKLNTTSMVELEEELREIRRKLKTLADRQYNRLLGQEIAFLVDQITLGNLNRDPKITVFDGAVGNLRHQMNNAAMRSIASPHNFHVFAHILVDDAIYLKVISPNPAFLAAFKKYEDVSVSDTEAKDEKNAKTKLWDRLRKKYADNDPCVVDLTPKPELDTIKYPTLIERVEKEARNSVIMHLLSQYSGGEQIPQFRLMDYMNRALEALTSNEDVQREYREKIAQLEQLLVDLENDDSCIYDIVYDTGELNGR